MREPLGRLDASDFDVLLSDIAMPGGTGYDPLRCPPSRSLRTAVPRTATARCLRDSTFIWESHSSWPY